MIERADQLVLDYVSKAADAAHGVLQPRQRIDFVAVLRRRIDAERAGTDDPAAVARVLARFGDPAVLVHRELRRLGRDAPSPSPSAEIPPGRPEPRASEGISQGLRGLRGLWGSRGGSEGSGAVPRPREEDPSGTPGGVARASGVTPAAPPVAAVPLAAPTPEGPGPENPAPAPEGAVPEDPAPASEGVVSQDPAPTSKEPVPGNPVSPPPRRPVRGHPYASAGAHPDAGEPRQDRPEQDPPAADHPQPEHPERDRPDISGDSRPVSGEDAADEWEDAVESDPPTEEIPPVQDPLPPPVAQREAPDRPRESQEQPEEDRPEVPGERPGGPEARPGLPPGAARGMREAEERLARKRARDRPDWLRRRRPARSREDVVPGTQDARTVLLSHRREMVGLALLALAGLLVPFPLAPIAIFRIPVLVWAVAVLVVIACENWHTSDKALGLAAPIVSYTLGGGLVALVRARNDLGTVVDEFFTISGLMFLLGTAWAVFWLAYRLLNPPIPVGRGVRRPG
ncbi:MULTISPECIES: hypothetical protein [unclassified Streptosporangium]|uniref:hypothetical protein n=1 Tax=unclassified Streptosporangium TaxID=2632669 RepID=UPI002E2A154B|nr:MULTISPECIES: hypothetical protein [unclassified Streptosporangium]